MVYVAVAFLALPTGLNIVVLSGVFARLFGNKIDSIEVILELGDVEDEILGSDCDGDVVINALCDRRMKSVNYRTGAVSRNCTGCANVSKDCENRYRQKHSHCE
jgi:hypothetical protein